MNDKFHPAPDRHAGEEHDHARGHDHGHSHVHVHAPAGFNRAFAIGVGLNLLYVALEAGYGLASGSLALLADAGHNLSDVLGLLLAWGASWLAQRKPTRSHTYGFKRGPILAALGNAAILLVAVGFIGVEAIHRLIVPGPVATGTILWVASVGVLVNVGTALMFMSGARDDLNIRGAFVHMAADAGVTVGVIIAALLIRWTGQQWIDPAISLVIAAVILLSTWGLLRDSVDLALDAVPPGIDPGRVEAALRGLPGVSDVHDLHIWGMSTTETALTAHLVRSDAAADAGLIRQATREMRERFGIGHATLQMETPEIAEQCALRPDGVV
ncbi:cation diffusion facilitator family transporter [Frigidibacter sp. ROC022]|uniref:cation diffusion facilitator family transporter n=1 Tax=Frigidibacter sp. ROC022 TaxID=2971796 RepID=UPI00215B1317|nr:cation diffusion facilitator family transporter [Frigidibacter sp. ROC022]MCR8723430.1 cation diffusion facilitator family transporter [Frigidibacter sp. ROC022]